MCGIAGFIDPRISLEVAEKTIEVMLESIAHRGPDARAKWFDMPVVLGHNRLSIIDLSDEAIQPMHFFDSAIIFNGEIYNYIEVREELKNKGYRFSTQSDTEVILAAYREYGSGCVKKFVGMWAFALWDKLTGELFCSRDRFGIKPFYYILDSGRFYFGSEYKALKKSPLFTNDINLNQVSRGLQLGWVCYDDETYYTKLKSLPAASNLIYKNGEVLIERYWDIDLSKEFSGSEEEKKSNFRELFLSSIQMHMRSDVEVGSCLSGGIDSSSIVSAVSKLFPDSSLKTFTIFYEGKNEVDERPWVNEVLKTYPSLRNFSFSPTDKNIQEELSNVLYHADVPISGSSPVSQYFVMKLIAEKKVKVVLDGQGADEYLAGYMHSFYRLVGGLLRNLKLYRGYKEFISHVSTQNFSLAKNLGQIGKSVLSGIKNEQSLYELEYKNYFPFLSKDKEINFHLNGNSGSKLNRFLYNLTFTTSLPSLLHYEDRNSMAFSIESRVPFLDHRLVEFVFSLKDSDKFQFGNTKRILRLSLRGIVSDSILKRKDKKGFVTPGEVKWLRGPLNGLLNIEYKRLDFISDIKVKSILEEFQNGNNRNANLVWRIAMLNAWAQLN